MEREGTGGSAGFQSDLEDNEAQCLGTALRWHASLSVAKLVVDCVFHFAHVQNSG
jgi:hypothetical protein